MNRNEKKPDTTLQELANSLRNEFWTEQKMPSGVIVFTSKQVGEKR